MQRRAEGILQDVGQLEGLLVVKLAGDLAAAGFNGRLDYRRRIELVVQDDGQALVDIVTGDLGEFLGALGIQGEVDFRLAQVAAHDHGALDAAAVHFRLLLDLHLFHAFPAIAHLLLALEDFVARLDDAIFDILVAGWADQAELQECRFLNGGLGAFLVGGGQTGQLDQNAVVALRLNERLGDAELVNAFAQHFDRVREGGAGIGSLGQAGWCPFSTRKDVPPCRSRPSRMRPAASRCRRFRI